jgi:hypothetical protein
MVPWRDKMAADLILRQSDARHPLCLPFEHGKQGHAVQRDVKIP